MPIIGSFGAASAGGFGQRKGGPQVYNLNYLVIAGGGSGGGDASPTYTAGGGGGAGGYSFACVGCQIPGPVSYCIVIGAGGVATFNPAATRQGGTSSFDAGGALELSVTGGGGGGDGFCGQPGTGPFPSSYKLSGQPGGSGGGGAGTNSGAGSGTCGQGNNGGTGGPGAGGGGAGGGGTGAVGCNSPSTVGGNGGAGSSAWPGDCTVRAGGGGGGGGAPVGNGADSGCGGAGGGGVGGAGRSGEPINIPPTPGAVNTGGGGGAGGGDYTGGRNGGSGVVLVRYPSAICVTLSPGCNTAACAPGGDKIATFTVSGTFTVNS